MAAPVSSVNWVGSPSAYNHWFLGVEGKTEAMSCLGDDQSRLLLLSLGSCILPMSFLFTIGTVVSLKFGLFSPVPEL